MTEQTPDSHAKAIAEAQRYPERLTCGLCTHRVNRHDRWDGCHDCGCMATPGEANTERPGHVAKPVPYRIPPIPEPDHKQRDEAAVALVQEAMASAVIEFIERGPSALMAYARAHPTESTLGYFQEAAENFVRIRQDLVEAVSR